MQEKRDRHEGELGHSTIALFMIPIFGESISTIILNTSEEIRGNDFTFRIFINGQNNSENNIQLHIHIK